MHQRLALPPTGQTAVIPEVVLIALATLLFYGLPIDGSTAFSDAIAIKQSPSRANDGGVRQVVHVITGDVVVPTLPNENAGTVPVRFSDMVNVTVLHLVVSVQIVATQSIPTKKDSAASEVLKMAVAHAIPRAGQVHANTT